MKIVGTIEINSNRCKGCVMCVEACPKDVIAMSKNVNVSGYNYATVVNEDACIGCASCGIVCPDGCITVYKKKLEE